MSRLLHSRIHQLMWYCWVFIVNLFSLLWSILFLKKICFLLSSGLLFIAESISLGTSGKPTVGFFFDLWHYSLLNNIVTWWTYFVWLTVEELIMNFLEIFFFHCCKRIFIWQKILEIFFRIYLNIIANVSDLKFEYYCEYYPAVLLQVSLK